ncbi:MAG TPA: zinc-binding alcohol dehydrogenase [Fimbriimonadaceae bacterium]|nr:zinc-binding alcohol dehydrogenase [Fimbriimonadaceae bacterium]
MAKRIVFTGKAQVEYQDCPDHVLLPGTVRIQAETTLVSTGTEGICYLRLFEPGSHFDAWVKSYPFETGYSMVGRVVELGDGVTEFKVGQRVASRRLHRTEAVAPVTETHLVPDELSNEEAVWFALATVGFMGAKNAGFRLGDSIAVVGGGPVGQMALRWAVAAGARHVVMVDPISLRLEMAKTGGATAVLAARVEDVGDQLIDLCGGQAPRVVVDATGHPSVLSHCLPLPRWRGAVLLLGDAGAPTTQHITKDVVTRGIQIIGAHIRHEEDGWTERAVVDLFFDLARRGVFKLDGLNTHRYRPEQCVEAYSHLIEGREKTMGILFDF